MSRKSVLGKQKLQEKEEVQQENENKILIQSARKLLLGVINPYLASELAYHIARYSTLKVLLIDADGMNPRVASVLGMKDLINERVQSEYETTSSFNMAMDYVSKNPSSPTLEIFQNIAIEHPKNKNLFVLTGNDDLSVYEAYSPTAFESILDLSARGFDLVIITLPYNVYDSFFQISLKHTDFMVYGLKAYGDEIFNFNTMVRYLNDLGLSEMQKHKLIPFEYNDTQSKIGDIKVAVDNEYFGVISESSERNNRKNEFLKTYCSSMSKKNIKEYHRLARVLGYKTQKRGLFGKGK